MTELVLKIEKTSDLSLLLPLLQRLGISFEYHKNVELLPTTEKKFNIAEMKKAFEELARLGTFKEIDPIEWQKQQRDEWESTY